jgi:hypothetical protein
LVHLEGLAPTWGNGDLIEPHAHAKMFQMPPKLVGHFRAVDSCIAQECVPLAVVTLRDSMLNAISKF